MIWQVCILAVGFLFLVKGADWFVEGAAGIAKKLGIPQLVIGLTIVAMGTSMPEAAVSITAGLNQNAGISIGNVVGSNIFNILFVLGTTALVCPIPFEGKFIVDSLIAIAGGVILWLGVFRRRELRKPCGSIMLLGYAVYFVYLLGLIG